MGRAGEEGGDARRGQDFAAGRYREIDPHTQCFQGIETPGAARHGPVSVLGHRGSGSGDNESRGRGNAESGKPGAPGAAGIDGMRILGLYGLGGGAKRPGHAHDLVDGLALHAQSNQKSSNLGRAGLPRHDLRESRLEGRRGHLLPRHRLGNCIGQAHGRPPPAQTRVKFASNCFPTPVKMDSG